MKEKPFTLEQSKRIKTLALFSAPTLVKLLSDTDNPISLDEAIKITQKIAKRIMPGLMKSEALAIAQEEINKINTQTNNNAS